jgi:hypothetical protein
MQPPRDVQDRDSRIGTKSLFAIDPDCDEGSRYVVGLGFRPGASGGI